MCFRPTEMSMNKCPQCGASNKPIAKECAQCGVPLERKKVDFDADQAALDAAMMPGMMGSMPGVSNMPSSPVIPPRPPAPSVPKPPKE